MLCKYCHYEFYVPGDTLGGVVRCPNCTGTLKVEDKSFIFDCPECGGQMDVSLWMIGSASNCPHCQKEIMLSPGEDSGKIFPEASQDTLPLKTASKKPGDIIGKYRVIRCLGIGGMGEVYLAEHTVINTRCALKLLKPDVAKNDPEIRARLLREARLASQIRHPNLIEVLDAEVDENSSSCYIAMEYVDGVSIESIIADGPMLEERALEIIIDVAEALKAASAHKIIHRDIKPANIMLSRTGEVKLADLGIAKVESDGKQNMTLTMDNAVLGTPNFASPEQLRSSHQVDCRADIYSLGATLYNMLTGQRPFAAESVLGVMCNVLEKDLPMAHEVNPDISLKTSMLIARMTAKKRGERPENFDELLKELNSGRKNNFLALCRKKLKKVFSRRYIWVTVLSIVLLAVSWLAAKMFYESKKGADPVVKVVKIFEKAAVKKDLPEVKPEVTPKTDVKINTKVALEKEIFQFSNDGKTLTGCLDLNIEKAVVPAGVISIGDRAFMHCRKLSEAVLPEGMTRIGEFAFSDCRNLKELKLPGSIETISQSAFAGCNQLILTLSANLQEVQSNAFDSVKQVVLPPSNRSLKSDGQGVIISADNSELIFVPWNITEYTVPDGVKKLRNNIFDSRRQLHKIQLPESVIHIGTQAFAQCDSLTELVIPDSVTELGFNILSNCTSLKQLTVPEHLHKQIDRFNISMSEVKVTVKSAEKVVAESDAVEAPPENKQVGDFILSGDGRKLIKCTNKELTNATIPKDVIEIVENAFEECPALTAITVPDSVTTVGEKTFSRCRKLKSITIPVHLKSQRSKWGLPSGCKVRFSGKTSGKSKKSADTSISSQGTKIVGDLIFSSDGKVLIECKNKKIKKVVIPGGVKIIKDRVFQNCSNLIQVTLPAGLLEIRKNAFFNCSALKKLHIPDSVTDIGDGVFVFCRQLKVNIPAGVENIGGGAFTSAKQVTLAKGNRHYKTDSYGAIVKNDNTQLIFVPRSVRYYEIPRGVKVVNLDAFYMCDNLSGVKIPDTVQKINNYVFFGCTKLKKIQIPDSVDFIGAGAFSYCFSLSRVTVPDSVQKIGTEAFYRCDNLKYLRLPAHLRNRKNELAVPHRAKVVFR